MHLFKRKRKEDDSLVDLTPMLDIVFIMLIFFIVTSSFIDESGFSVNRPPEIEEDQAPSNAELNAVFEVDENGEIFFEGRRIDVLSIRANIDTVLSINPKAKVIVRAHEDSHTDTYVQISDAATDARRDVPILLITYR